MQNQMSFSVHDVYKLLLEVKFKVNLTYSLHYSYHVCITSVFKVCDPGSVNKTQQIILYQSQLPDATFKQLFPLIPNTVCIALTSPHQYS